MALVCERALATVQASVHRAEGCASRFAGIRPQRPPGLLQLAQDCHGAPGIVNRLAAAPRTPEWDRLLLQAGELIWRAGPLAKGAGLCHGTTCSGFAMLKLWRRSAETVWLDRARALAMHGCGQIARSCAEFDCGRHSLCTGELGLACLLWGCIAGNAACRPSMSSEVLIPRPIAPGTAKRRWRTMAPR